LNIPEGQGKGLIYHFQKGGWVLASSKTQKKRRRRKRRNKGGKYQLNERRRG